MNNNINNRNNNNNNNSRDKIISRNTSNLNLEQILNFSDDD